MVQHKAFMAAFCMLWSGIGSLASPLVSHPMRADDASAGQMIAVASYINPASDPAAWDRLVSNYPNDKLPILVANSVNGPDTTVDPAWQDVIDRAAAAGKTVLGYVRTGYLGRNDAKFATRLGSTAVADWAAQIERDVDAWYELYGDSIKGIFFDEGWWQCGPDSEYHDVYKHINAHTKRQHPGAYTVLNPGSPIESCYAEDTMDTIVSFEGEYQRYVGGYVPNNWTPRDARKLWHIVYNVPEDAIDQVVQLSRERGAGFVQATNDVDPNPYDTLPGESYMQKQIAAVGGGTLINTRPAEYPAGSPAGVVSDFAVDRVDYSSASISWGAASNAVAYDIYTHQAEISTRIASVPAFITKITIGGLDPGSSYDMFVVPIGGGGVNGSESDKIMFQTTSLPGGTTVTNISVTTTSDATTTVQADLLLPYSFKRIFLWDRVGCDFASNPGWPVYFGSSGGYVCAHYFVEGEILYRYSGAVPEGTTNAPWSWEQIGTVEIVVDGYRNSWTLPLGRAAVGDTSKVVVQVEGYAPGTTVFSPDPSNA